VFGTRPDPVPCSGGLPPRAGLPSRPAVAPPLAGRPGRMLAPAPILVEACVGPTAPRAKWLRSAAMVSLAVGTPLAMSFAAQVVSHVKFNAACAQAQ
jgi:hypothetical protein